ncbi:DUF1801 domain-containing protein [Fulvivirga ligni]|uniref:DUF1801 domain-containing protein n=1 Tax=Fulvivirga ligni TaxID=2904246 RepID=UPI001F40A9FB|nr:DUF1801 domain-containing protein [Fulvivirga ligni]UII20291.1 DUF1801 domain-containing protein [Fulvivirga ligni]
MDELKLKIDPRADVEYDNYPSQVKERMLFLRNLVIDTARKMDDVAALEITLKWGEPSFITKNGSTLRMDWKQKTPDQYAMYFQCTSRLVNTFRSVFGDLLKYEGNRAVVFDLNQELPVEELKECIKASLRYHKVKDQITLGI